jgi:hypothetical protein
MDMDDVRNPDKRGGMMSYRDMAARCRELAGTSRHPGPLLRRAEVYDACAEAEQPLVAQHRG